MDAYVDTWGYYSRECTSWVAWRLHSRNGFTMARAVGNANQWDDWARRAGYAVNSTPAVGAIAQSDGGSFGHVAWVESVGAGTVTIEEYNHDYRGTYGRRTVPAGNFVYIHVKDLSAPAVSEGSFVVGNETGRVYRVAGGAPIYVESWTPFGGPQPVPRQDLCDTH